MDSNEAEGIIGLGGEELSVLRLTDFETSFGRLHSGGQASAVIHPANLRLTKDDHRRSYSRLFRTDNLDHVPMKGWDRRSS